MPDRIGTIHVVSQPAVAQFCRSKNSGFDLRADKYGWSRFLNWLRGDVGTVDLKVLSLVMDRLVAPRHPDHFDGFRKAADTLFIIESDEFELVRPIPDCRAQHDAPVRNLIDHRDLFCEIERIVQSDDGDIAGQAQLGCACGNGRQRDERLRGVDAVRCKAVMADRADCIAEILCHVADLERAGPSCTPAALRWFAIAWKSGEGWNRKSELHHKRPLVTDCFRSGRLNLVDFVRQHVFW